MLRQSLDPVKIPLDRMRIKRRQKLLRNKILMLYDMQLRVIHIQPFRYMSPGNKMDLPHPRCILLNAPEPVLAVLRPPGGHGAGFSPPGLLRAVAGGPGGHVGRGGVPPAHRKLMGFFPPHWYKASYLCYNGAQRDFWAGPPHGPAVERGDRSWNGRSAM